jgi:hypothetical protein
MFDPVEAETAGLYSQTADIPEIQTQEQTAPEFGTPMLSLERDIREREGVVFQHVRIRMLEFPTPSSSQLRASVSPPLQMWRCNICGLAFWDVNTRRRHEALRMYYHPHFSLSVA